MKKDEFIIIEDFPHCEIDFDKRFSKLCAFYEYLLKMIWPNGFACSKCGNSECWARFKHLQNYLDEYVFRFNRRKSASIGKKFIPIVQQAVKTPKIIYWKISCGVWI